MWLIDCSDRAYNKSQNEFREFFVLEQDGQIESKEILHLSNRRLRALSEQRKRFFVCEKWRTPNSNGETQIFDYYEFATYTEACVFIADLIVKLNSPIQNALIKAAQSMVDKIIPIVPPKAKVLATKLRAKTQQIYECDLDEITFNDNYSRVYVMLFDNAAVKIGVSQNVKKRMKQFEGGGMLKVLKLACT